MTIYQEKLSQYEALTFVNASGYDARFKGEEPDSKDNITRVSEWVNDIYPRDSGKDNFFLDMYGIHERNGELVKFENKEAKPLSEAEINRAELDYASFERLCGIPTLLKFGSLPPEQQVIDDAERTIILADQLIMQAEINLSYQSKVMKTPEKQQELKNIENYLNGNSGGREEKIVKDLVTTLFGFTPETAIEDYSNRLADAEFLKTLAGFMKSTIIELSRNEPDLPAK